MYALASNARRKLPGEYYKLRTVRTILHILYAVYFGITIN